MLTRSLAAFCSLAALVAVLTRVPASTVFGASATSATAYNRSAAAHFLDRREIWWQQWPRAQKDHGTVCVSCHTQLPYALIRPTLRRDLQQTTPSLAEQAMLTSVEFRVNQWEEVVPFYSDAKNGPGKTLEARNAESVLNAIILSRFDQHLGHLRPVTAAALDHAWQLQLTTGDLAGSWQWQNFHLGPWEDDESGYQLSALLLLTACQDPDDYALRADVQPHLALLRNYLVAHYAAQPILNQLYLLWASNSDPTLLTANQRQTLLTALAHLQAADGGFNTFNLDHHERIDDSPAPTASDGYATAIATLALQDSPESAAVAIRRRARAWLTTHQQPDGTWLAESINKHRDPATDPALFMTDAATAYAALALDASR